MDVDVFWKPEMVSLFILRAFSEIASCDRGNAMLWKNVLLWENVSLWVVLEVSIAQLKYGCLPNADSSECPYSILT